MKIKILASALSDLKKGFNFYEKQSKGLGNYFLDSLYSDVDSLLITAGIHPIYSKNYHRLLSKRFPFAIFYKVKNNHVLVYAILDCRKNSVWIRKKLK